MLKIRYTLAITAALATAVTFTACSSNTGSGSMDGMNHGNSSASPAPGTGSGAHNDADIAFAMIMVPHHKQAVEMADLLLAKDGINTEVIALAEKIKAAQQPEITTMNSWLKAWGADTSTSDMGGMDHGGMMSEGDMNALDTATGLDASKLFLQQMTQHHQGAIDMANSEINEGKNRDALALAKKIIQDQTVEITEMQRLLATDSRVG